MRHHGCHLLSLASADLLELSNLLCLELLNCTRVLVLVDDPVPARMPLELGLGILGDGRLESASCFVVEPFVEMDERDEVVVALGIGLANEINSSNAADLLKTELLGDEVLACIFILGVSRVVVITRQRTGIAARNVEGHLGVERHVVVFRE